MSCLSGILMGAFTVSVVVADMWVWRTGRIIPHIFLGGIVTALFFTLCQHGYELVNWSLLGFAIICLFISIFKLNLSDLSSVSDVSDTSDTSSCACRSPCSCRKPRCKARINSCL